MDSKNLNLDMKVNFSTRVIIEDPDTGEVFVDKSNAIHSQNMARAIARGLANEPNSTFYRMAFGNGGSRIDAAENIQLNPPNDGTRGEGWESRLYNETYSEVIQQFLRTQDDIANPLTNNALGTDIGSSGPEGVRVGGGSDAINDDPPNSVISVEVGRRSNIIATTTINRGEPLGQLPATAGENTITEDEQDFSFDELGIYTRGRGAAHTAALAKLDVGTKSASDPLPSAMLGNTYNFTIELNGTQYTIQNIEIPSSGLVTYGDLCELINNNPSNTDYVTFSITNTDPNSYPSIGLVQTFGFLVIRNDITPTSGNGSDSTITLNCGGTFLDDLLDTCSSGQIETIDGEDIGVLNSKTSPESERERLLTHITFPPILKKANRQIRIRYILTVSVAQVGDTVVDLPA